ncbi:GNAT family N-acetyltransferase [Ruminiclostridium josui]|uniref:GNAT family N-acetyltransferase n=1 Tax=Ruminiclostridium josui TaxID=1499 RepID=UPI000466EDF1|nr:GNAT family N-acetyltransferase [Ruminiclostridium josui]
MVAHNIETERLIIMPMTHSMVCTVLSGSTEEYEKLGVKFNGKWPLQDTLDILHFIKDRMKKNETDGFYVWMIVKKEDMTVIGDAGFKGAPNENGEIEIGFGFIKEEQQKGYGYEAASSLIEWASQKNKVKVIKADCLIDNIGSIKLLKKCGMIEINRDSELIYWENRVK